MMKRLIDKKTFKMLLLSLLLIVGLSSCSKKDFLNAIPKNSSILMAIDIKDLALNLDSTQNATIESLLNKGNLSDLGIDESESIYLFETQDGNIGIALKVQSKDKLESWFLKQQENGFSQKLVKKKDYNFTIINSSWVAGFSSSVLVAIGPILPTSQAKTIKEIEKYLSQDSKKSIKSSPLFEQLEDIDAPIRLVAIASGLPKEIISPFILEVPKDIDLKKIMVSLSMTISKEDSCLEIHGRTTSMDKNILAQAEEKSKVFRKIQGKYIDSMSKGAPLGIFMNIDGNELLDILNANQYFQSLLMGANMAIDMNNIIKSIDGDISIVVPSLDNNFSVNLVAQLSNKDFLKDIPYWKESCPIGGQIDSWGKDAYYYIDENMSYFFGVNDNLEFFSGKGQAQALESIKQAKDPLSNSIKDKIKGEKLSIVINLDAVLNNFLEVKDIIKGVLPNVSTILYLKEDE